MELVLEVLTAVGALGGAVSGLVLARRYLHELRHVSTSAAVYTDITQSSSVPDDGLFESTLHNLGRRLYLVDVWFYVGEYGSAPPSLELPRWLDAGESIKVSISLSAAIDHADGAYEAFQGRTSTLKEKLQLHSEFVDGEGHRHRAVPRGRDMTRLRELMRSHHERLTAVARSGTHGGKVAATWGPIRARVRVVLIGRGALGV